MTTSLPGPRQHGGRIRVSVRFEVVCRTAKAGPFLRVVAVHTVSIGALPSQQSQGRAMRAVRSVEFPSGRVDEATSSPLFMPPWDRFPISFLWKLR